MGASRTKRVPRVAKAIVGASVLAFPATAMAVTKSDPLAAATPTASLGAQHARQIGYRAETVVRGSVPSADAGTPLALEYRAAGQQRWKTIAHGTVHRDGRYALSARIGRSGGLQVIDAAAAADENVDGRFGHALASGATPASSTGHALDASPVSHISVRPRLKLSRHAATAIAGHPTAVRGRLLPGIPGRRLVLEVRTHHHWSAVASTRTGRGGTFDVHFTPASTGAALTRVVFTGDAANTRAQSTMQSISEMQYAEVSWYDDAGNTACGFHATYGIASRTLPCGTKVTLSEGGRSVVATVDDRGPYVYSRLYDLDQNTAAALGMDGVATVLASL